MFVAKLTTRFKLQAYSRATVIDNLWKSTALDFVTDQ